MYSEQVLFFDEQNINRECIVTDQCYCLLRECCSCQNLFCNKCIQTWLNSKSTTCPLCRSRYEEKSDSSSTLSLLSQISICCRNILLGCTKILLETT